MKTIERLFVFFPFLLCSVAIYFLIRAIVESSLLVGLAALVLYYGAPPFLFRVFRRIAPIPTIQRIGPKEEFSTWMISLALQQPFLLFPATEKALQLIPGLYSAWLRLWGSKIGKGVFWTPGVTIVDRGGLEVGDRAFFGNLSYLSPHIVYKRRGVFRLHYRPIRIGERSFVGAWSRLGPGAEVDPYSEIPAGTDIFPLNRISRGERRA